MSIVKYKNQSGVMYAYEQTSSYDPELKQSRPIRKYLGRVDPETGEIISTAGKRGRPPKNKAEKSISDAAESDYKVLYEQKCRECDDYRKTCTTIQEENARLSTQVSELKLIIRTVRDQVSSVKGL